MLFIAEHIIEIMALLILALVLYIIFPDPKELQPPATITYINCYELEIEGIYERMAELEADVYLLNKKVGG